MASVFIIETMNNGDWTPCTMDIEKHLTPLTIGMLDPDYALARFREAVESKPPDIEIRLMEYRPRVVIVHANGRVSYPGRADGA